MRSLRTGVEWILLIILLIGVLFLTNKNFVEKEVLPKEYVFIFLTFLLGGILLLNNRQPVRIDWLTIIVLLFILYLILVSALISHAILEILSLLAFLFLFFFFKYNRLCNKTINSIIIMLCVLQAGLGLLQYFHLVRPVSNFSIVGSYDNPAGFAACLAVGFPLGFSLAKESRFYKVFSVFVAIIIVGTIILSESRAGVVSIITVSIIFLISQFPKLFKRFKKYLLPSLILVGAIAFVSLIYLKKDSASGRLLIWQVTWKMIKDNPIVGGGSGAFLANYMEYQAGFFIQNPESKYALLADNVLHPFNEYLLLAVEYGIIGVALLIIGIILLLKSTKISSPYMLCLVALGIFSLFSYPLKYPFIWIITAYCLAQVSKNNSPVLLIDFLNKIWVKILIIMTLIAGSFLLVRDMKFEYNWNKTAKSSLLGKTKKMLPQYEKLYQSWNGNHLFLYNYGAELNHIGEYEQSLIIFEECIQYWNDYDIQMLIADNYLKLEKWNDAESHYQLALNMCPNRFVPLAKLHEIYMQQGRIGDALNIAYKIVEKEIKIPSSTIASIKSKMKKYIDSINNK